MSCGSDSAASCVYTAQDALSTVSCTCRHIYRCRVPLNGVFRTDMAQLAACPVLNDSCIIRNGSWELPAFADAKAWREGTWTQYVLALHIQ
jgi:hypothetical protein